MNIEIRKLTSDLAEDYVRFFDMTPHSEKANDDECKCYCVWFDFIEAYPKKEFSGAAEDFMGPADLFRKSGFVVYGETEDKLVMKKSLR